MYIRQCSALAMLRRAHAPSRLSSRVRARDAQRRDNTIARASSSSMDVPSLASVADKYDVFLLDQFGVLHDGKNPYPGAIDAARALASIGKSYIISNSSRESSGTIEKLTAMGFNAAWFAGAKTSGSLRLECRLVRRSRSRCCTGRAKPKSAFRFNTTPTMERTVIRARGYTRCN